MNTKDKGMNQMTLIEFSEEQQAFHLNLDGRDKPLPSFQPVMWMRYIDATHWTYAMKHRRDDHHITLLELLNDEVRTLPVRPLVHKEPQVFLACKCTDDGADVLGVFGSENDAYHCIDCEGGDYIESVPLRNDYDDDRGRIYRITLAVGQDYEDIKENIRTSDKITGFEETDVMQAVRWDTGEDNKVTVTANIRSVHRYAAFSVVRNLLTKRRKELKPKFGQWYEWPTMRELHPRKPSQFESEVMASLFHGGVDDEQPFAGFNDIIEQHEENSDGK